MPSHGPMLGCPNPIVPLVPEARAVTLAVPVPVHVCDACDAERWGASKRDVLDEGWKFHDAKGGRMFVLCGGCERRFGAQRPSAGSR